MGPDKAFIRISGKPVIEIILNQLASVFDDLVVVANASEKYEHLNVRVIPDIFTGVGPLGGLHAGLKRAKSKYVFVLACDMPFISLEYIAYMQKTAAKYLPDAVLSCKGNWLEPFHALYSRDLIAEIETSINKGSYKVVGVLKQRFIIKIAEEKVREYSPDLNIFINLNNKKDLRELYAIIKTADGEKCTFHPESGK